MNIYKIGKVVSQGNKYVIFESNYEGLIINCIKPEQFQIDKVIKMYIYIHRTEYVRSIYGFKTFRERILFEDLISVNGVGPKTALGLLALGFENVVSAINSDEVSVLTQAPLIGQRVAGQIVFELKSKYKNMTAKSTYIPSDVGKTLKTLGFKKHQIDFAINNIKKQESVEAMVEEAIVMISNEKFATH